MAIRVLDYGTNQEGDNSQRGDLGAQNKEKRRARRDVDGLHNGFGWIVVLVVSESSGCGGTCDVAVRRDSDEKQVPPSSKPCWSHPE